MRITLNYKYGTIIPGFMCRGVGLSRKFMDNFIMDEEDTMAQPIWFKIRTAKIYGAI